MMLSGVYRSVGTNRGNATTNRHLVAVFASPTRADEYIEDHDGPKERYLRQEIYIPDEAVALVVASAMDNLSTEELKSVVDQTGGVDQ